MTTVFTHAAVLDVRAGVLVGDQTVVVDGDRIVAVGAESVPAAARRIDLGGRTLMPGLIDVHVHATQATADFAELSTWPPSYAAHRSAQVLSAMLRRGFTTVRDVGGADAGLARALREGLIEGPRLMFGGPIHAPSGGHVLTRICDGPDELRRALREQFAQGAHHVKLTLSGSVVSPIPLEALAYSDDEIAAAVDEARRARSYVAGHAYTAEAVNRALVLGVRTIEHGSMIDDESVRLFRELGAFLVPTLATFDALANSGAGHLTADGQRKLREVLDAGLRGLELADRGGVPIGYGTDLHGELHDQQSREFLLRAQVQAPADIVRSATVVGAEIVGMTGRIGEVAEGALADLLVVDGDPLAELALLADPARSLRLIMQGGRIVMDGLAH